MSQKGPHFSPHSKAKANYKSTNLRKLVTSGTRVVAFASVCSVKTSLKNLMNMIIIITITEKPFTSK